jgi:hypothetical protein
MDPELARLTQELATLVSSCGHYGWDGYDGEPVRDETAVAAGQFIARLPNGIPLPTLGAEPDGSITLEWYRSPFQTVSISINANNSLHYSALLDSDNEFGMDVLAGQMPKRLLDIIHRIHA